jgi:hypothetical protein
MARVSIVLLIVFVVVAAFDIWGLLGVLLAFIFCAAALWALRNPAPERAPVRARRGRR